MMDNIKLDDIKRILDEAFQNFYQFDYELLDYKTEDKAVSERCMVFRIGWYIQNILKRDMILGEFSVDSEYNRCFNHPKSMYKITMNGIKEKIGDAIPDLIIHKRKSNMKNLAMFEFKKSGQYEKKDEKKIIEN